MKIVLCRVDERLVHGEIVNQWLGFFKADYLLIADDELIEDAFMCLMYKALLPIWVKPQILSVPDAAEFLAAHREEDARFIFPISGRFPRNTKRLWRCLKNGER